MQGRTATFNMTVPIMDYYISVNNAMATQIPEPITLSLSGLTLLALLAFSRPAGLRRMIRRH